MVSREHMQHTGETDSCHDILLHCEMAFWNLLAVLGGAGGTVSATDPSPITSCCLRCARLLV